MTELVAYPWAFWIGLAILAAILEMILGSFSFIFVCIAAILTALIASRFNWVVQWVVFGVSLLVSIGLVRPIFLSRIQTSSKLSSRAEVLVGKQGRVTQSIDPTQSLGRVEVEGEDWAARSSKPIALGVPVLVESHDGIVLIVKEVT